MVIYIYIYIDWKLFFLQGYFHLYIDVNFKPQHCLSTHVLNVLMYIITLPSHKDLHRYVYIYRINKKNYNHVMSFDLL